ncbi:MAG: polysaccharide biosynthesis tyrosine autokinase, partial [Myxococcales bacterium]
MAKVYDALRRAEEERKRRASAGEVPFAPMPAPAAELAPAARLPVFAAGSESPLPGRASFWRRLWTWRNRAEGADAASDANKRRITLRQPESFVAEQFRTLRGRIDAMSANQPLRTIVVTSPNPGDGKTTAAINLATVTALSLGRRVLLVDCDLRKPKVHLALGLRPEAGLAEVLTGSKSLDEAILKVENLNLDVLAVRGRPPNPSELLSSANMVELIEELAKRYDRVILDTPAALGMPDAKAVAEYADGIVLVVRADVTSRRDVESSIELIDRRRLLGLLLNGAQM